MSIVHLTEASSGAPTLSGTNGALAAIMDWALPQNGWAIEYTSGNARVYRPGSGNRFRLHLNDDSGTSGDARLCIVRGCENASNATTLVDPWPTVALIGNTLSNWGKSLTANSTAINYDIYVGTTFVIFVSAMGTTANTCEWGFFGDFGAARPGDSYNTIITVRNNAGVTAVSFANGTVGSTGVAQVWIARSLDGTVKSTRSAMLLYAGTFGQITGASQALAGATAGIDSEKVAILDSGGTSGTFVTTTGLVIRGYLPNIRNPLHFGRGSVSSRDVFGDTSYNAGAGFKVFCNNNGATGAFLIVEETDTWAVPLG